MRGTRAFRRTPPVSPPVPLLRTDREAHHHAINESYIGLAIGGEISVDTGLQTGSTEECLRYIGGDAKTSATRWADMAHGEIYICRYVLVEPYCSLI